MVHRGRSPTGRGRALKPSPVRVRIPPPPRSERPTVPRRAPRRRRSRGPRPGVASAVPRSPFADRPPSISWCTSPSTGAASVTPSGRWPSGPTGRSPCPPCTRPPRTPGARSAGRRTARPTFRAGSRLRLHDSVTTDVERFASLADSDDPRRLVEAMHLVRGPLFDGLRRSDWAVFDGTQSRIESLVVRTALRGAEELGAARLRRRGRLGGPPGAPGEPLRRAAVPLVAARHRGRRAIGSGCARRWPSCSTLAGEAERPGARLPGGGPWRRSPARVPPSPRRRPSTVACWRARLPPEGTPPGCRVASRHGEKLLWEVGSPRRRNGRWCHLSRADAGQLVRRAGDHRPDRDRIGRPRQVPLQPDPDRGRADHEHHVARGTGLRHLRDDGAGARRPPRPARPPA